MKNQKGLIWIPILIAIIAGVLVIGSVGYLGVSQYKSYQNRESQQQQEEELTKQTEQEQQKKLQELFFLQSTELEKQKAEIEALKKGPSATAITPSKSGLSRADIISQWTPSVAYIECNFVLTGTASFLLRMRSYGIDTDPITISGSGFVHYINTKHSPVPVVAIITNRHVLNAHNGFSGPTSCEVILPGNHKYSFGEKDYYFQAEYGKEDEIVYIDGQLHVIPVTDAGWLWVRNPNPHIKEVASKSRLCDAAPRIGDDIVILGYPGIGSGSGITATEGIISGLEEKYFVTSAKVEHGNSGGVALFKDQNCYFGIPTFARSGEVESLARILDYKRTFIVGY